MNELSAFFRPTPVDSPACNNGRIAIDAYPEIINDRRRGPDSWIINPGYPLLFIDQNITCPALIIILLPAVNCYYGRFTYHSKQERCDKEARPAPGSIQTRDGLLNFRNFHGGTTPRN